MIVAVAQAQDINAYGRANRDLPPVAIVRQVHQSNDDGSYQYG